MSRAPRLTSPPSIGEVLDFDEALLDACPPEQLAELMREAEILAQAFTSDARGQEVAELARKMQSSVPDLDAGRAHARLLSAALRRLSRES
jgi:hypothetical protein